MNALENLINPMLQIYRNLRTGFKFTKCIHNVPYMLRCKMYCTCICRKSGALMGKLSLEIGLKYAKKII